jgi:hypothetical protein
MPLPGTRKPQIFSLRANNITPDNGVLPTLGEQKEFNIKMVKLNDLSHIEICRGIITS